MNTVTLLNKGNLVSPEVHVGQIYSKKRDRDGELRFYIVTKVDGREYYLICLQDGERWSTGVTDIDKVFGWRHKKSDFTLVTDPIVIKPNYEQNKP